MRRTGFEQRFGQMEEDASIDACFDFFRRKESVVDVRWVKEQVYRTSCIPESCPVTRSLFEIFSRRPEEEEGEISLKKDVYFRFN